MFGDLWLITLYILQAGRIKMESCPLPNNNGNDVVA